MKEIKLCEWLRLKIHFIESNGFSEGAIFALMAMYKIDFSDVQKAIDIFNSLEEPELYLYDVLNIGTDTPRPTFDVWQNFSFEQVIELQNLIRAMHTAAGGKVTMIDFLQNAAQIISVVIGRDVSNEKALDMVPIWLSIFDGSPAAGLSGKSLFEQISIITEKEKFWSVIPGNLSPEAYKAYTQRQADAVFFASKRPKFTHFNPIFEFCKMFPAYTFGTAYAEKYYIISQALMKASDEHEQILNISTANITKSE